MNIRRSIASALVAATLLAVVSAVQASDAVAPKADARVEHGRYMVAIMGCNDCHTPGTFYGAPDAERFLSGSELGWVGPWGVVYAANLTPDAETGLGKWKPEEIAKAIRSGNRPDGRQLATAMPWRNYAALTVDDALAIALYLKTLKPVKHAVPKPVEPGIEVKGALLTFPPPSPWDAPRAPAEGAQK